MDKTPAWQITTLATTPANRFESSKDRYLLIDPAPVRDRRTDLLIYPLLEVYGKSIKVETQFTFQQPG